MTTGKRNQYIINFMKIDNIMDSDSLTKSIFLVVSIIIMLIIGIVKGITDIGYYYVLVLVSIVTIILIKGNMR